MTRFIECIGCGRPIEDEGSAFCIPCELHDGDELHEADCGACGSPLGLDGACQCDLGSARGSSHWWGGRSAA
jgi:hypothetical protein